MNKINNAMPLFSANYNLSARLSLLNRPLIPLIPSSLLLRLRLSLLRLLLFLLLLSLLLLLYLLLLLLLRHPILMGPTHRPLLIAFPFLSLLRLHLLILLPFILLPRLMLLSSIMLLSVLRARSLTHSMSFRDRLQVRQRLSSQSQRPRNLRSRKLQISSAMRRGIIWQCAPPLITMILPPLSQHQSTNWARLNETSSAICLSIFLNASSVFLLAPSTVSASSLG